MKHLYDRHAETRQFSEGDQVLALLPIVGSPFHAKFVGAYSVLRQLSDQNYLIATPDRRKRQQLCHVNLLKPYYAHASSQDDSTLPALTACTVVQSVVDGGEEVSAPDDSLLRGRLKSRF